MLQSGFLVLIPAVCPDGWDRPSSLSLLVRWVWAGASWQTSAGLSLCSLAQVLCPLGNTCLVPSSLSCGFHYCSVALSLLLTRKAGWGHPQQEPTWCWGQVATLPRAFHLGGSLHHSPLPDKPRTDASLKEWELLPLPGGPHPSYAEWLLSYPCECACGLSQVALSCSMMFPWLTPSVFLQTSCPAHKKWSPQCLPASLPSSPTGPPVLPPHPSQPSTHPPDGCAHPSVPGLR